MELQPLITIQQATVYRSHTPVLTNINWTLRAGECWAVVGNTGAGKTSFLQALAGLLPVRVGQAVYPAQQATGLSLYQWLRQNVLFVSFKEDSRQFSYNGHFYQQRYHATMGDDAPTVRDFLQCPDTPEALALVQRLGLEPLLDVSLLKLSNGQTRKARIGKAFLQQPSVLLIDNPFVGLDASFRQDLSDWLGELVSHGLSLVLVAEPDKVPSFVTHVAWLDQGQLRWAGPCHEFSPTPSVPSTEKPQPPTIGSSPADFTEAFRLQHVTVRYGETCILNNLSWEVRAGEKWALLGANGAGKSVLLSLLYGDHPQAYANDVRVFGHRRGNRSGGRSESIWDVKRRIGFVSPELHLYFPGHLTARQVALTGLTDTLVVPRPISEQAEATLISLFDYFGINHLQDRAFGTLSAGEQRLTLLIRAFVKRPPLLLLDEPFQALDERSIQLARQLLDALPVSATLLFVTHDRRELPDCVSRVFQLSRTGAASAGLIHLL